MANNTVKKLLGIALAIVSLAGCSSSQKSWEAVATEAGFQDVRVVRGNNDIGYVMYGTAGSCPIRLVVEPNEDRLYATVPGSENLKVSEFFGDPSVELLKKDPRFEVCFEGDQAP